MQILSAIQFVHRTIMKNFSLLSPNNFYLAQNSHVVGEKIVTVSNVEHLLYINLMILFLVLLIIIACIITGVLVYYRIIRPKRLARRPPRNIELISRPSVLIL